MKMMMLVMAPADGIVQYEMLEGSVLNAGDLIARLDLDDPAASQVLCLMFKHACVCALQPWNYLILSTFVLINDWHLQPYASAGSTNCVTISSLVHCSITHDIV